MIISLSDLVISASSFTGMRSIQGTAYSPLVLIARALRSGFAEFVQHAGTSGTSASVYNGFANRLGEIARSVHDHFQRFRLELVTGTE